MKSANKSTKFLLGVIAVLLALDLWVNIAPAPRSAQAAGLPDSGAQLQQVVDEVTKLNKTVEKMQAFIESGKMTVKVDKPEK